MEEAEESEGTSEGEEGVSVISEVLYDEYEQDEAVERFKRKPGPLSQFSLLVKEFMELAPPQKIKTPKKKKEKVDKTDKMKEGEKSTRSPAAIAAEAEQLRNVKIKEMQEEIRLDKHKYETQLQLEINQGSKRKLQLEKTCRIIHNNEETFMNYILDKREEEEWLRYMTCDGLPDPGVLSQLNTFLYLWDQESDEASMQNVTMKCEVGTYLLEKLDNIINFSIMAPSDYIDECKYIRRAFREKLKYWIDLASYRLLRHIEWDMIREDLKNATFVKESNELICCVWALIQLPISIKQVAERDRKSIEVVFKELELTLRMPADMDCYAMAIRGLWLQYDHYSDLSPSFLMPEISEEYRTYEDLLTFCLNEYENKMKIRHDQVDGRKLRLEEKKAIVERLTNPPPVAKEKKGKAAKKAAAQLGRSKKNEQEQESAPLPDLPTPDEIVLGLEEENRKEIRKLLFRRCEKTEINLRKYAILGGVLNIDLIYQPPQPKDMRRDIFLTTLQLPKYLKFVPFSRPYKAPPPAPDAERTPEVIEAEIKALEAAMEKLALITLQLPDSVLWLEPPLVAHWIPERKIWSTQDVHDIKYNEEKQIITFRSGRLGVHGLAAFKFINIPFQSWELKPETGKAGGVVLTISAAIVQVEFIVKEDLICLHSLAGGGTAALQDLVGKYMDLNHLIQRMRAGGCDLFPERDAISYVKGLPVKHQVAERHLQACMGLLSTAYMFAWSRWNAAGSPRQIVMQIKELHGCIAKERTNMTLLVTPLQTMFIQSTEVGSEFCDRPLEGEENKFFADVYHLALHTAGIKSRLLMKAVSFKLATTVTRLLEATKVISMST